MAGLLDFLAGSDGAGGGAVDPRTIGLLSALSAAGQSMQPTRLPTSGLGNALGVLGAYGEGVQGGQLTNAKLGILSQQGRAAQIGNDLNQINLDYYRGAQQPTRNPVAGVLSQGGSVAPGAAGPGILNGGAVAPGGSGFLLDPASVLARAQAYSAVPGLKDQALQMLKLYEQMISTGKGATASGAIAPFTGAPESAFTMAHADELGKTLAGNNKDQIVGPSAAYIPGPRTMGEYQTSLQPGQPVQPAYVNPMSPQNITLNTGKTLAEVAVDQAGKNLGASQTTAQAAADLLPTLQRGQQLIPQVISGPGADLKTTLTRLFNPSDPRLAATAEYLRTVGSQVGNLARQVGGTQISDADRRTAEKLAGGDLSVTPAELQSVLSAAERAANTTIQTHNARAAKYTNAAPAEVQGILRATTTVDAPPGYAAGGSAAPAGGGQTGPAAAAQPPMQGARQAPDGNWYVADPQRPGKYLQVK